MTGGPAVVVGGGIAGLAAAALLAREGHEVTLLEARDDLGGRASTWAKDGFTFDTGPSWYLMPEVFDHFFRLLGTTAAEQLDLVRLDPAYRVFYERFAPVEVRSDREDVLALVDRIEPGARGRMAAYLDSASEAYRIAVGQFLYTTFADLRRLAGGGMVRETPRLTRLLTESLEHLINRTVRDTRLRQILGYPSVFLGASPALTPSMYHLMSHLDLVDGVLYPRGGMGTLISAIADLAVAQGVDVRTGSRVERILTAPANGRGRGRGRRALVTGVEYTDAEGVRHQLFADVVVSTADLHHTETALLPRDLQTRPAAWWRRRTAGPSAVMVLLGVRGELPELTHHSLFFAHDWQRTFDRIFPRGRAAGAARDPLPDPTSVYVSRTTATDPSVAPEGSENVVILVPVPADPQLGRGGEGGAGDPWVETVADAAIAQVAEWAGIPDLADRVTVRRTIGPADYAEDLASWQGTALGPAHTLRQSAMLRAGNVSRRVSGLLYAGGSTIPGIGLPMCLISAELVIKRLRGDVSVGPLPEPLAPSTAQAGKGAG